MMENTILDNIGKEKLPSVIQNPFNKNKIHRVYVFYSECCGKWSASGSIEFKNGNTCGEQKFEGETFDEIVLQMKAVINQLLKEV